MEECLHPLVINDQLSKLILFLLAGGVKKDFIVTMLPFFYVFFYCI